MPVAPVVHVRAEDEVLDDAGHGAEDGAGVAYMYMRDVELLELAVDVCMRDVEIIEQDHNAEHVGPVRDADSDYGQD
jgi:hypothetical protein